MSFGGTYVRVWTVVTHKSRAPPGNGHHPKHKALNNVSQSNVINGISVKLNKWYIKADVDHCQW